MCGIAGAVERRASVNRDVVYRMTHALRHRGPDREAHFFDDGVGLGVTRLSIIDVSGGWQPLRNEDSTLMLVANGEIYNFVELRAALERNGHSFHSGSDCEVIVHLYEEYGAKCVHHLRGMFAFALWDSSTRRLLLARDRMGEKPLYLYKDSQSLFFASEMKSLLRSRQIAVELDPNAINLYFHYGFVPEPRTAIRDVWKLDAGELLTLDVDAWVVKRERYWKIDDAPAVDDNPTVAIRNQLDQVADIIIRSDVPIGIALSGGFDSAAVAALLHSRQSCLVTAFIVGYRGFPQSDERESARETAAVLGIPVNEIEISTSEVVDAFADTVEENDDPIADIAASSYRALMQRVHATGTRVLMQGHGGDELFWGYEWVREAADEAAQRPGRTPQSALLRELQGAVGDLRRRDTSRRALLQARWGRLVRHVRNRGLTFYDLTPEFATAEREATRVYSDAFASAIDPSLPFSVFRESHDEPANPDVMLTRLICDTYLRGNGIAQADRLGMAASVEVRLPLVDFRLVETVVGLRKTRSDRELPPKQWFKDAVQDVVPLFIGERPKKGFTPPVHEWTRAILKKYDASFSHGALIRDGVLSSAGELRAVRGGNVSPLRFSSLILEIWYRAMKDAAA